MTTACSPGPDTRGPAPEVPERFEPVAATLPKGDRIAGRQAFLDLRCTTCHLVTSEPDFPATVSNSSGPELGTSVAGQYEGVVMTSIVAPSHSLSGNMSDDVRSQMEGVLSPMGDFSAVMT